jgi:APA family basic amino acid/polyamine antiporter
MPPSPWLQKPLWVVAEQEHSNTIARSYTLFDLVCIGVGGTIGSGIFVLSGYIAHHYAGPSTTLSFAISGLAASCSGLCYAELSSKLPATGSVYVYAYVAMGELAAVLAAACLTLEYAVSGAAVARSWGDKVIEWCRRDLGLEQLANILDPGYGLNPMAIIVSAVSVGLLVGGVKQSKFASNLFTSLKVALVIFMIIGGFWLMDSSNLKPFLPMGFSGVLRGATSSFFGYLGYDEVCCLAGEALHPHKDMPRAIIITLALVTVVYVAAALVLTGMQHYSKIDDTSGFPSAFSANGWKWAAQVAAAGEVVTLPVVVLISLLAQPRLLFALVQDGLLPPVFGKVDATGNLRYGTIISGALMTLIAGCIPFNYLDDLISSGILVAFCMTNTSLLLLRCSSPKPHLLSRSLAVYNSLCCATCVALSHGAPFVVSLSLIGSLVFVASFTASSCPRSNSFGGASFHLEEANDYYFDAPFVPYVPFLGIFANWYLIAQLEWIGLLLLILYLGLTASFYWGYCSRLAVDPSNWRLGFYEGVQVNEDDDNGISVEKFELEPRSVSGRSY